MYVSLKQCTIFFYRKSFTFHKVTTTVPPPEKGFTPPFKPHGDQHTNHTHSLPASSNSYTNTHTKQLSTPRRTSLTCPSTTFKDINSKSSISEFFRPNSNPSVSFTEAAVSTLNQEPKRTQLIAKVAPVFSQPNAAPEVVNKPTKTSSYTSYPYNTAAPGPSLDSPLRSKPPGSSLLVPTHNTTLAPSHPLAPPIPHQVRYQCHTTV